MAFELPPLPYARDAFEGFMSEKTFDFHYGKHHQAYVNNLNKFTEGTPFEAKTLEEIILETSGVVDHTAIFNNAAQVWNHTFFWHCMQPNGPDAPGDALLAQINADFGSLQNFEAEFEAAAISQFGSGWAWLVLSPNGKLSIVKTSNAGTPLTTGHIPLLTIDVWEHAYYLDYQNSRPSYVNLWIQKVLNWKFVTENYEKAIAQLNTVQ